MDLARDIRGIYVIWYREVLRFIREKPRIITSLVQPVGWLLILGTGFGQALKGTMPVDYHHYLFPGILTMTVLFTSLFSAVSVVWDREFGFLREILVAPVSRMAIVLGKALGGSTTAMIQGVIVLLLGPLIGVPLSTKGVALTLGLMYLLSFTMTSAGLVIASRMDSMHGFQLVMNFIVMPMYFLSGAFFPIDNLPGWLRTVSLYDPLTFGVDALRTVTLGISGFGLFHDLTVLLALALLFSVAAVVMFDTEG